MKIHTVVHFNKDDIIERLNEYQLDMLNELFVEISDTGVFKEVICKLMLSLGEHGFRSDDFLQIVEEYSIMWLDEYSYTDPLEFAYNHPNIIFGPQLDELVIQRGNIEFFYEGKIIDSKRIISNF